MSTKYKEPKDVPASVLIERLNELASAVVERNTREFAMQIPAQVDWDADIVLAEVARRLELATKALNS